MASLQDKWNKKKPVGSQENPLQMPTLNISAPYQQPVASEEDLIEEAAEGLLSMNKPVRHDEAVASIQAKGLQPKSSGKYSGWDYIASVAAPAITGILSGDADVGYKEAAGVIDTVRADEASQAKNMLSLWKSMGSSKKAAMQLKKDDQGRPFNYDPNTGQGKYLDGSSVDPENMRMGLSEGVYRTRKDISSEYSRRKEDRKVRQKALEEFNKELKILRPTLYELDSAIASLGKGQLMDKLALMSLVKKVETRLSDQDRAFYTTRNDQLSKLKDMFSKEIWGELSPDLMKEVRTLLQGSVNEISRMVKQRAEDYAIVGRRGSIDELADPRVYDDRDLER